MSIILFSKSQPRVYILIKHIRIKEKGLALVHTAQKDGHPFIFFLSLKKEIVKIKGAGVEPCPLAPLAGMITTTLPASRLVIPENCKTIKRYPYYFIRANRVG